MASKSTRPLSAPVQMRRIVKPVVSTDVMGNRNVEVRAVGAWVEPAPLDSGQGQSEAVMAAKLEQERIQRMQREKAERLRRFQEEVKQRVRALERAKRKQQEHRTLAAMERERRVVSQSTQAAEGKSQHKDRCIVRREVALSAKPKPEPVMQGGWTDGEWMESRLQALNDQTNQVHKYTNQARQRLMARKVVGMRTASDDLPGGKWGNSRHAAMAEDPRWTGAYRGGGEEGPLWEDMEGGIDPLDRGDDEDNENRRDEEGELGTENGNDMDEEVAMLEKFRLDEEVAEKENLRSGFPKTVHFDLSPSHRETREERIGRKSAWEVSGSDVWRVGGRVVVPDVCPGVAEEEEKRRQTSQAALYRRLFMDLERQQVRENRRRQDHRLRIARIKREKEAERRKVEEEALRRIEPRDPLTGETSRETMEREEMENSYLKASLRYQDEKRRKALETERYLDALRRMLRERMELRGIQLPPLCCCGMTVWDTHPETCANNCIFYRNPREYAKALQSLLASCDL